MPAPLANDYVVLPNGNIMAIGFSFPNITASIYTPPSTSPIQTFVVSDITNSNFDTWYDAVIGPNGIMYVSGTEGLYTFDYTTGALSFIGSWPMANPFIMSELMLINGIFYGVGGMIGGGGTSDYYRLDMLNPSQSVLLQTNSPLQWQDGPIGLDIATPPGIYVIAPSNNDVTIQIYDTLTNTLTLYCDVPNFLGGFYSTIPPNISYNCLCQSDAGTVPTMNATLCVNQVFTFTYTGGFLDNNDIRQFILFTNPADTIGSIIVWSNTATFSFNPSVMQTGVVYYFATIVGNTTNGNIDLGDPCLDISNAGELVWQPIPEVNFSISNPDACVGECRTVTANFTGTPPFVLTYSTPFGGVASLTFTSNTGTFQVCIPPNAPVGPVTLEALSIEDASCLCQ